MKYILVLITLIMVSCSNKQDEMSYKDYKTFIGDTMKYNKKEVIYFGYTYRAFVNESGHTMLRNNTREIVFHDPDCQKCVSDHNNLIDRLEKFERGQQHTDSLLLRILEKKP